MEFKLFGLTVRYYGVIIALGMLIGVLVACKICKKRNLTSDDIFLMALYVLPLSVIGARIYYVAFSGFQYSFWEVFEIWNGGMAIYGGVIGGTIGVAIYCLIHKKNFLLVADVAAVCLILGQAIGRWGNFCNQEAYGYEVTNKAWQWFPFAVFIDADNTWHLATFFYESMWNFVVFGLLLLSIYKVKINGLVMCEYFILYGIGRVIIEGLRTDSLYLGNTGIRVSQFLSAILIILGVVVGIILIIKNKKGINIEKDSNVKNNK